MPRFRSLPAGNPDRGGRIAVDQANVTSQVDIPDIAVRGAASVSETRAGVLNDKSVTPLGLTALVSEIENDIGHAWGNWATLVENENQVYGTQLITGLPTYNDDNGGQATESLLDPTTLVTTGSGVYSDAALVYNGGFNSAVTVPSLPVASDRWETSFIFRGHDDALYLMIRWRVSQNKVYRSAVRTPMASINFVEIDANDSRLRRAAHGVAASTGWHFAAPDANDLPPIGNQADFQDQPWALKRVGDTLYALSCGYEAQQNRTYRLGTSTQAWEGRSAGGGGGGGIAFASQNSDLPSGPSVGDVVFVTTAFGSFTANTFYRWNGTIWASAATLGGGGGGSSHPHEVSAGGPAPSDWSAGDWVYNVAENAVTITNGSASAILSQKTIYRINSIATNTLTMSVLRLRMNEMPSGDMPLGRLFPTTAAANTVPVSNGSGGGSFTKVGTAQMSSGSAASGKIAQSTGSGNVSYDDLPNNSVGYNQLNDLSKGANRIIHYNAAGTGITSSPHTDFDIDGTQITSGTIPAARVPTLPIDTKTSGNLPASRVTGRLGLSNLPANLSSGIEEATDLDDKFGEEGLFRFGAYAENAPLNNQLPGILFAEHNDQTVLITGNRLDGTASSNTAGRIYTRAREFTYGGITGVSDLVSGNLGFTQVASSGNLNDLANGFAFYFGNPALDQGNVKPTNSPPWAPGLIQPSRVATMYTSATGQVVLAGGAGTGANTIRVWVRPRSGNTWDTGGANNGWYLVNADDNHNRLSRIGLTVITSLHQLRSDTQASDLKLWLPSSSTAEHPRAVDGTDVSTSSQPIWVSRYALSGTDTIRFVWNHGGLTGAGNAVELKVRTTTETITGSTASAWDLVDDNSVTSGTYSSTNGTITLTKADSTTVAISGLPYVTSS